MNKSKIKKVGQDVIKLESAALAKLSKSLDKNFVESVELLRRMDEGIYDEEEFERYREDMLREYDFTFGDDWDGSMDIESYIVRCWVGLVIDKWYDEEDESKNRKKKPDWKDTTELIEETLKNSSKSNETYSDLPLPAVFSTKPSPLQEPQLKEPW